MKVTENVYALDSTKGNYAYLILDEEIILVDTGRPGQGKSILNEIKSLEIHPEDIKKILITHHDIDHVGNLALLQKETGASIFASKEDIPYICGDKKRHGIKKYFSYILKTKKPNRISSYPEMIGDIQIIETPGHTPGHVCMLYKDVLFVGDLFRTSNGKILSMRSFMNWNDAILKESIVKINHYNFECICPAHGEPIKRENQLDEFIKELR